MHLFSLEKTTELTGLEYMEICYKERILCPLSTAVGGRKENQPSLQN